MIRSVMILMNIIDPGQLSPFDILQLIAVNRRAFHDFVVDLVLPEELFQLAGKRSNALNMEMKCIHARKVDHIRKNISYIS